MTLCTNVMGGARLAARLAPLILVVIAGCRSRHAGEAERASIPSGSPPASPRSPSGPEGAVAPPNSPRPTGRISGRVSLAGKAPSLPGADMRSDPVCATHAGAAGPLAVTADGGVRNVLVHLEGAPPELPIEALPVAVMHQSGCAYQPRVMAIRVGQRLEVWNDDPTFHNVHLFRDGRTLSNRPQVQGSAPVRSEVMTEPGWLRLACDVHPWMAAHVWVSPHSLVAVSDDRGQFSIDGVPAGTLRLEAWHELLGTRTSTVEVTVGAETRAEIVFTAAGAK